jgi:hypothetical protein
MLKHLKFVGTIFIYFPIHFNLKIKTLFYCDEIELLFGMVKRETTAEI